jgi:hypothetical protein
LPLNIQTADARRRRNQLRSRTTFFDAPAASASLPGEVVFHSQDLAPVAQRALGQQANLGQAVDHDSLGLEPLNGLQNVIKAGNAGRHPGQNLRHRIHGDSHEQAK